MSESAPSSPPVRVRVEAWSAWRPRFALKPVLLTVIAAVMLGYSTMFSGVSLPNERSRAYLAVAIVDHGTLSIDEPVRRFGAILDVSRFGEHFYSDKAPGSSLLGAAAYGAVRLFTSADDWPIQDLLTLMRLSVMLPLGLLGFWAVRRLLYQLSLNPGVIDLASLGWILGSAAFHYSVAFYGHQIAAVCLLLGLLLALRAERLGDSEARSRRAAMFSVSGAGVCGGLAGITEYQAGVASLLLGLYVMAGPLRRHGWAILGFAAGAIPFLVLLGGYNTLAFGGPFELSYHHLAHAAWQRIHTEGIGGITWPHGEAFYGGFLSLHRGLIPTSPMFLLCLPGAWRLWRWGRRRLCALLAGGCLYYALLISSSNMWVAGWAYGPRLLVAAMGWGTLLAAVGLEWLARWRVGEVIGRASLAVGIVLAQSVHAFFPEPQPEATNPLVDIVAALYARGLVAPNVVSRWTGVHGLMSLVPLVCMVGIVLAIVLFVPVTRAAIRLPPGERIAATKQAAGAPIRAQDAALVGRPRSSALRGGPRPRAQKVWQTDRRFGRSRTWVAARGVASGLVVAAALWCTARHGPGFTVREERSFVHFVRDMDAQEWQGAKVTGCSR